MRGYNFTERIRKVLAMAREDAERRHHEYVGTEHITSALIAEGESVACTILHNLGIDFEQAERRITELVRQGRARNATGPDLPYTSRAKRVLELAMAEAGESAHGYVGCEHLLLGILREGRGVGAQVLIQAGVTLERARTEMYKVLGSDIPAVPPPDNGDFIMTIGGDVNATLAEGGRRLTSIGVLLRYADGSSVRGEFNSPETAIAFMRRLE